MVVYFRLVLVTSKPEHDHPKSCKHGATELDHLGMETLAPKPDLCHTTERPQSFLVSSEDGLERPSDHVINEPKLLETSHDTVELSRCSVELIRFPQVEQRASEPNVPAYTDSASDRMDGKLLAFIISVRLTRNPLDKS